MAYKPMWDWMDKVEGKKVGSSHANLEKEKRRQGYKTKILKGKKNNMKKDSMGGTSRFNPFAEKWRASNKKRSSEYYAKKAASLKMAKVDAPGAKEGIKKVIR